MKISNFLDTNLKTIIIIYIDNLVVTGGGSDIKKLTIDI